MTRPMDSLLQRRRSAAGPAFRVGLVKEQDVLHGKVRVVFPDYDQVISYWLPILFAKTQNDKQYWIPDLGEQVVCLMDLRDEAGAVLGAIYSTADTTPVHSADKWHLRFKDGAFTEYDRSSHVFEGKAQDGTDLKYDAQAHLFDLKFEDGAEIKYDGAAHLLSISVPQGGKVTISAGEIDLESGAIKLGGTQVRGVARLGDQVTCPAGTGTITSASQIVEAS
jgi:phage baseplate assembly protein gpV